MEDHLRVNAALWDERAAAHAASDDYAVQRFVDDPAHLSDVVRFDLPRLGEVRGLEVVDLLAALNTGHEGGAGTVHANSARDVPARLEALAAVAGLGREALHSQLASGLRVVVHLARSPQRRVAQVCVLARGADGWVRAVEAWSWDGVAAHGSLGPGAGDLRALIT